MSKQGLSDKCIGIVYDAIVLNKMLYALSSWGGYTSQALKDRIDASFRKAYRWKLTDKQYKFDDLLSEVDNRLFACSKVESHCLRHVLPSRSACSQMALRSRECSSSGVWIDKTLLHYAIFIQRQVSGTAVSIVVSNISYCCFICLHHSWNGVGCIISCCCIGLFVCFGIALSL